MKTTYLYYQNDEQKLKEQLICFFNYKNLKKCDPLNKYSHKIKLMSEYAINRKEKNVPDPYYHGEEGFEIVLDILEDFCQGLLIELRKKFL